jgi:hypothetical protein
MSDRAKKITEFDPAVAPLQANDMFVMVDVSANATVKTSLSLLRSSVVVGPYANDSTANTGGVAIGQLYYTSAGEARVRIA